MSFQNLTDKNLIESYLRQDPLSHIYGLCDLEEPYWNDTLWPAWVEQGEVKCLFYVYKGFQPAVCVALAEDNPYAQQLMTQFTKRIPLHLYCHLSRGLGELVGQRYQLEPKGIFYKLRLEEPKRLDPLVRHEARRFNLEQKQEVESFLNKHYPSGWFDDRMMATGKYFGIYFGARLVSVAGVHVFSKKYGVASLGNVVTDPEFQNKGYGASIVSSLCKELLQDVETIGLNVRVDNKAAVRCYEKIGFQPHAVYEEVMAYRQ